MEELSTLLRYSTIFSLASCAIGGLLIYSAIQGLLDPLACTLHPLQLDTTSCGDDR